MQNSVVCVCMLFIMQSGLVINIPKWWNVHGFLYKQNLYNFCLSLRLFGHWVVYDMFHRSQALWISLLIKMEMYWLTSLQVVVIIVWRLVFFSLSRLRTLRMKSKMGLRKTDVQAGCWDCTNLHRSPTFDTPDWPDTDSVCVIEWLCASFCSASKSYHHRN